MKLDLSKFKKHHEDGDSVIMEHADGHQIKIAKKSLSTHLQKRLGELKFADGGEVRQLPEMTVGAAAALPDKIGPDQVKRNREEATQQWEARKKQLGFADGGEVPEQSYQNQLPQGNAPSTTMTSTQPGQLAPGQSTTQTSPMSMEPTIANVAPPQQAPPQVQVPQANPMAAAQPGMNQEIQGIQAGAAAQSALGQASAKIEQAKQMQQQELMAQHQQNYMKLDQERMALQKDISDGHIDARRFINSKSDGGKIMTAIGIMLGGLGQGMARLSSNPAMDFLNKQIEQDIDAQKAELGKKQNLLAANEHQFGNLRDATNMTRVMMADQYITKLEEAKAKATTPMAKANADVAIGQLKQKYAPLQAQVAQSMTVRNALQEGKMSVAQAIPAIVPKEHQAEALKELGEVENAQKGAQQAEQAMREVAKLQSSGQRLGSPIQSNSKINALNLQIANIGKQLFGNMSEQELKMLKDSFIDYTDNPQTVETKIQNMKALMSKKNATPTLNAYGLSAPKAVPSAMPNPNAPQRK